MNEIFNTRHNPMIDPAMHIWGWEISVYLFLGGLVAGMMVISGYFLFSGRSKKSYTTFSKIPVIGIIALSLGMLSLFLDLENKINVWRMYATFQWTSPMSWGSWILLLVYPVMILTAFLGLSDRIRTKNNLISKYSEKLESNKTFTKILGMVSMIAGAMLGLYTGVLLSAFGARPAWNSSILWLLFLVSGLSSAAAFIHLITKDEEESHILAKADNNFLIFELVVIFMLLIGFVSSSQEHIAAAMLFLNGPFSSVFWVFVIGIGIVVPLILQLVAVKDKVQHSPVVPIMVILGGLLLRFIIVAAGQYSHWSTAVFK